MVDIICKHKSFYLIFISAVDSSSSAPIGKFIKIIIYQSHKILPTTCTAQTFAAIKRE